MDEPEQWRWIWLVTAVVFGIGEMASPGSFFLAPFALGAAVAALVAWADVPVAGEWAFFVGVSVASFIALRPVARRLNRDTDSSGIGSRRLIGREGIVQAAIEANRPGLVRVDQEEWRADSADRSPIDAGTAVRIIEVEGTRVIVTPSKELSS